MDRIGRISRRQFLHRTAGVAVFVATPATFAYAARRAPGFSTTKSGALVRATWVPLLGTTFRMTGDGQDLEVVLAEVSDLRPIMRANDPSRFSLVFEAPPGSPRLGGIRTFRSDKSAALVLSVGPIERGHRAVRYEAVVNSP